MPARAPKTRAKQAPLGPDAHSPGARDAALRRLSRAKRWLLAGTVALTGVLTAVAANAFPGKSVNGVASSTGSSQAAASSSESGRAGEGSGSGESSALQAPAQEPESSGAASEAPVVSGGS
jgi:hypothetical protein